MNQKFATRLRRRQRNRQKVLNIFALFGAMLLPIYPVFGNYVQDYTGAIVRGNYDASTIIATYDAVSGVDIVSNVLDVNTGGAQDDWVPDVVTLSSGEEVKPLDPVVVAGPKEDPRKILYPIHIVTPKQTLDAIMKQYSVSLEALKAANPGLSSDLKIDQKIIIPAMKGVEYIVKKGDTLSVIAQKYGIENLYHILVANDLSSASKIRIGQKLFLPNPTKDPNPKKPEIKKPPVIAQNKTPPPKNQPSKSTQALPPKKLTYGTYSLDLKVEKGCRNFAWGNCTCFVAKYKNVTWRGNAKQWLKNAQKAGAPTGQDPKPGAIVVYDGYGYSPYYGHVGIVMEVGEDHIIVKDMNYSGLNQITTRRENYRNNSAIKGYIYVD